MMIAIRRTIFFLAVLAVAVESFHLSNTTVSHDDTVTIILKGISVYIGALAEDRKITINAAHGLVRIQIKGRKVAIVGAECPDQLCVKTGWRSHEGESIFCEPNELAIHILGKQSQGNLHGQEKPNQAKNTSKFAWRTPPRVMLNTGEMLRMLYFEYNIRPS